MPTNQREQKHTRPAGKLEQSRVPKETVRWLEKILAASTDPAFFFAMEGHYLLAVNHKFVKLLGFNWEELLAKRVEDLLPSQDIPRLHRALKQDVSPGAIDCRYLRKDGTTLFVRLLHRDNAYLDADKREHAIRLVVITRASEANAHKLELPPLPFVDPGKGRLRRMAWLHKLAISSSKA